MVIKDDTSTRFMDEVRIISRWAWLIAAVGFLALVGLLTLPKVSCSSSTTSWTSAAGWNYTCTTLTNAGANTVHPPKPMMVLLGIVAGTVLACLILLIGYINADAGRRGMSRFLWTLLSIFIPNGIGILLYFLLRKPRILTCPQCRAVVEPGFGFCPQCRHSLNVTCPQCQRGVNAGGKFCPYCSAEIGTTVNA
jgi:RNA polymerase subunit RPABC4/transcription elongation factor Spt4